METIILIDNSEIGKGDVFRTDKLENSPLCYYRRSDTPEDTNGEYLFFAHNGQSQLILRNDCEKQLIYLIDKDAQIMKNDVVYNSETKRIEIFGDSLSGNQYKIIATTDKKLPILKLNSTEIEEIINEINKDKF